jgi:hypothetical protein
MKKTKMFDKEVGTTKQNQTKIREFQNTMTELHSAEVQQ